MKRVNTKTSRIKVKRDAKGKWLKGTPSPNPKGAPPRGMSLTEAYTWVMERNAEEMADVLEAGGHNDLADMFRRMPKGIENKHLWAARIFAAVMFEPQPGLVNHVVDRMEGKVTQPISGPNEGPIEFLDVKSDIERKLHQAIATSEGEKIH